MKSTNKDTIKCKNLLERAKGCTNMDTRARNLQFCTGFDNSK
jgi:hypothetical protein